MEAAAEQLNSGSDRLVQMLACALFCARKIGLLLTVMLVYLLSTSRNAGKRLQRLLKVQNILLTFTINNEVIERTDSFKYLGVTVNSIMSWSDHVDSIIKKINQRIGLITRIKHLIPITTRLTLYNSLIVPLFDYGDIIWGDKVNITLMNHLQVFQNKVAKTILDLPPWNSASDALKTLNIAPLSDRRFLHRCTMVYKCLSNSFDYDFNLTFNNMIHSYDTRNKNNLHLPRIRTNWGKQRFSFHAAKDWNSLDTKTRELPSLSRFKSRLKNIISHSSSSLS